MSSDHDPIPTRASEERQAELAACRAALATGRTDRGDALDHAADRLLSLVLAGHEPAVVSLECEAVPERDGAAGEADPPIVTLVDRGPVLARLSRRTAR